MIWHSINWGSGGQTGRFTPFPRRDIVASDGSRVMTPGFSVTIPDNGIIDTSKFHANEIAQAETAAGPDWEAKLNAHIKTHAKLYGLAPGLPGEDEAVANLAKTKAKVIDTARSAGSVQ